MNLGLKGRTAVVGGASQGLGRAVALALAQEGITVALSARNEDRLRDTAEEIEKTTGVQALPIRADHTQYADIKRIVEQTITTFGRIDILFTNTGGPTPGTFFDFDDRQWQAAYEQLLLYVVRMCREVIPHMKRQRWGRIINNASVAVKEPYEDLLLSNVFRVGVTSLGKTLSRQMAQYNVLINTLCPGFTRTERAMALLQRRAEARNISLEDMEKITVSEIPVGFIPYPEGVASLVVFLASERASSLTGTTIQIDGGHTRGLL
ncbi:MAG: SDR family oxidoreductase [Gemmatimonadota bacterium]|nr:MAG: SDR family oxidoreductase [Gemmatimonadota bacterium]